MNDKTRYAVVVLILMVLGVMGLIVVQTLYATSAGAGDGITTAPLPLVPVLVR